MRFKGGKVAVDDVVDFIASAVMLFNCYVQQRNMVFIVVTGLVNLSAFSQYIPSAPRVSE